MFAVLTQPSTQYFRPSQSSPLSLREPNACYQSHYSSQHMSSFTKGLLKPRGRRQSKYSTVVSNKNSERDRRRDLFLKKVKQAGDDTRWGARGDQVLRSDFIARQRRWEEEKARSASEVPSAPEDEEMDVENASDYGHDIVFEEILLQEERELDALSLEMDEQQDTNLEQKHIMPEYGTDDEEYERLLVDALEQAENEKSRLDPETPIPEDQHMDTEMG
ncbi:MAG: hypothetical protein Q9187_002925 [Circinaria calcarea]